MTEMFVMWAQYSDRSDDPVFLGVYYAAEKAEAVRLLIEQASPGKNVKVSAVPINGGVPS